MFTESVRIGSSIPAFCGGSAKYLIFHHPPLLCVQTLAPPTCKPSYHGSLRFFSHTSRVVVYCKEARGEEARREEATHSPEVGVSEKFSRTDKSDTEMDTCTEAQSHSQHKKEHMTNIYLMDSDEEAIVDFVKDHGKLYDKTNEHSKDKARKQWL